MSCSSASPVRGGIVPRTPGCAFGAVHGADMLMVEKRSEAVRKDCFGRTCARAVSNTFLWNYRYHGILLSYYMYDTMVARAW